MSMVDAKQEMGLARSLITPEGVDLGIQLASAGQRAGAFVTDCLLLGALLTLFTIVLFAAGIGTMSIGGVSIVAVIWLLGSFLLRNFYFIFFETGRRAATPGKRLAGIRVAARDGGRLTADAIIARNFMREIEIFLPLSFLGGGADIDDVIRFVGLLWAGIFLLFPLFNADRLRAGDLIAGTWVVRAPREALLTDLGAEGRQRLEHFAFSDEQLAVYGEYELQTLETVLRSRNEQTLVAVADTVKQKISWSDEVANPYEFLSAYYAALGAKLQRGMLFGRRRRNKFDI